MECNYCVHVIEPDEEYWLFEDIIVCEMCLDDYFEDLKYECRKTNEKDWDNEIDEILMERGE